MQPEANPETGGSSQSPRRLIGIIAVLGLLSGFAALAATGWRPDGPVAAFTLIGVMLIGVLVPVRYTQATGTVQGFNLAIAAVVACLFVAPAGFVVVGTAVAVALGSIAATADPIKTLFNTAQHTLSAAAAALVFHVLPTSAAMPSVSSIFAAVVMLVVADVVGLGLMFELMHRLERRPRKTVARDSRDIVAVAAVGDLLFGLLLALLAVQMPEAVVLVVAALIAVLEILLRRRPWGAGFATSQFA